jgi:hypothetical protein
MANISFNARNGLSVGPTAAQAIDASRNGTLASLTLTTPLSAASGGIGAAITGMVKGSGSAYLTATVGTDYVAPNNATLFTVKQTFVAGSSTVSASINIPNNSVSNTPVSGDVYGLATGLQWHNGTAIKQIAYADGTNSAGTWGIDTTGTAANATNAAHATSLSAGTVGGVAYQSAVGTTSFLALGTSGQVFTSNGVNAPQWVAQNTLAVSSAASATNISGGAAGGVVYQSAAGATTFLALGASGSVITSNGVGAPQWSTQASLTVGAATTATHLAGGSFGTIPYQSAAGTTVQLAVGTAGFVLQSNGAAAPTWVSMAGYALKAGAAFTGALSVAGTGSISLGTSGDVILYRSGGASGYIFLNSAQTRYIGNDGTNFVVVGQGMSVGGAITASGDITALSDGRLKTNIVTLVDSKAKVRAMRGVSFDKDGRHSIGVIAQEIQEVRPEYVLQGDKYLSVAYGNITADLIEAFKTMADELDVVKQELATLKGM